MGACSAHVQDGPDPEHARRPPPDAQDAGRGRRPVAVGLPAPRAAAVGRVPERRGVQEAPRRAPAGTESAHDRRVGPRGAREPVIVVDASALADVLLRLESARHVEDRILDERETLPAPHLIDLEILSVLRRFAAAGAWQEQRATEALSDFAALRIARHPHEPLRERIWEMRENVTAYDA